MVLSKYSSAVLAVMLNTPKVRPGGEKINRFQRIKWEDATETQREELFWIEDKSTGITSAHLPLTPHQKEEIKLNDMWHRQQVCKTLLEQFNVEYARRYAESNNIDFNFSVPYCTADNQCNLLCPFFKKGCTLGEEIKNEN